jgi:hypothetical protein
MTSPSFAFFITAQAESFPDGANRFGSCASIVLWNAPSVEAAEPWAREFVKTTLRLQSDQQIMELKVLPVDEHLLTWTEPVPIQWASIVEDAEDAPPERRIERHSTVTVGGPDAPRGAVPWRGLPNDMEAITRELLALQNFDHEDTRHFYYIACHDKRAFVTRAPDLNSSAIPYIKAFANTPDGYYSALIQVWPGARNYQE